ncbi:Isopentenyl-diphosphate delta-isomerase, FMN-dependent [Enhygromyxa salina]|uniref:Isopentenyl-diphosphate delta-isomerase n=1 Tax=Enhygromyxa salina TaxID=215803 RepID=A0A0C2CYV2_9BACT|nr:type 2 isopentenyl-diphosphate Delta-isomerase [Enhygromyxa salina]KIG14815.1 Isopentenyl-diphosphate delta-isomerase, FMN-dependent [Enhygromyxa salina]
MADRLDISQRKKDHLALCAGDNVGFREKTALFEQCDLVHCALPEMHADEVDSRVELLGKTLAAPVVISAMTGGTDEAAKINKDLAQVADELGLAMGLGSQRAMFERPETAWTFEVRDRAPNLLLFGNLGLVQARKMSTAEIRKLCADVGADALCIHLNPAMEIVQPGGDRDFGGGLDLFRRLVSELGIPVIAKETGCGISRGVAQMIRSTGVEHFDVSGAGGTSWVAVEAHRAEDEEQKRLAQELWDWGIPTAASVLQLRGLGVKAIATGGLRTGSHVAKAVALGATAGGLAAPVLKAHRAGGIDGAREFLRGVITTVRSLMLLTGSRTVAELQRAQLMLGPDLARWQP